MECPFDLKKKDKFQNMNISSEHVSLRMKNKINILQVCHTIIKKIQIAKKGDCKLNTPATKKVLNAFLKSPNIWSIINWFCFLDVDTIHMHVKLFFSKFHITLVQSDLFVK